VLRLAQCVVLDADREKGGVLALTRNRLIVASETEVLFWADLRTVTSVRSASGRLRRNVTGGKLEIRLDDETSTVLLNVYPPAAIQEITTMATAIIAGKVT
jgi:hypothetical protein